MLWIISFFTSMLLIESIGNVIYVIDEVSMVHLGLVVFHKTLCEQKHLNPNTGQNLLISLYHPDFPETWQSFNYSLSILKAHYHSNGYIHDTHWKNFFEECPLNVRDTYMLYCLCELYISLLLSKKEFTDALGSFSSFISLLLIHQASSISFICWISSVFFHMCGCVATLFSFRNKDPVSVSCSFL